MRWILLIWLSLAAPAFAQIAPDEQRAREIGAQLRCVVCQNQSIEESDAQLAQDMRRIVREQLATGASNDDVISHIRDSYGDYVLLKPPVQSNTYVLWFFPFGLVIVSFIWWLSTARRREVVQTEAELSENDKALLSSLMDDTS
jgi:cytochrome c-type biogenesis protein CcmH